MASTITAGNATNGLALSCDNTGILELKTGTGSGTTAITADASQNVTIVGNVGVGTTTMTRNLNVSGSSAAVGVNVNNSGTSGRSYSIFSTNSSAAVAGALAFFDDTAGSYRAVIDSSGALIVNSTSKQNGDVKFSVTANSGAAMETKFTADYYPLLIYRSGNLYGSIYQSGTSTAFNTSSDYRLKENIQPMTGALAKVAALKPCTYTWKFDGSDGQGFIAHELAEVMPDCVTGEKDAMEADGVTPRYQGVDTSFLVATLTAAIQEQQQMIETLQAKVAALEAK